MRIELESALDEKQWDTASRQARELLKSNPDDREAALDLVFALEQSNHAEEAAAFLRTHPRLWHGKELSPDDARKRAEPIERLNPYDIEDEPDAVTAAERRQMIITADALVERAAFETSLQNMRCQVCHHRTPTLSSPPVTEALFADRKLLTEAASLYTLAQGLESGERRRRLSFVIGRSEFKIAELFPPKHREAHRHLETAIEALSPAIAPRCAARTDSDWCVDALNYLGLAEMKRGNVAAAEAHWRRATTHHPDDARAWSNLASARVKQGDMVGALASLRRAVTIAPKDARLRTNLGLLLVADNQLADAAGEHREAIRLDPKLAVARINYAQLLARAGERTAALAELHTALKVSPNSANAHNGLGLLLLAGGNQSGAREHFRRAIEHAPGFADAYRNLGAMHAASGEREQARGLFRRALALQPDDATARRELERLQ